MPTGWRQWWDALAEGVVLIEGDRVVDLNAAAAMLLDVDPARVRGATLITALRDHRLEQAWRDRVTVELELRARRVQLAPLPGALLLRDLTGQRRAEEDARELLAVLSHELRTPVTSIRAVLDALVDDPDPATAARFLPRAGAEAERLTRLLDDLTVDVKPPRVRRVPLGELAERALGVLQPLLDEQGVRVQPGLVEATALVDEDKLLQVMVNLLENAAVHGPSDATVELVAWRDGGVLRLEVRDGGTPLDPSSVEALFAPHSRGRGGGKGTGLGLYIVRSIARRWGGDAWGGPWLGADGAPRGNAFGVSVPLAPGG